MAKATDKQKKKPILQKNNKSKTKKRNNEESTETAKLDDIEKKPKKIKINIINKSIDETKSNKIDNDKNKEYGSTDNEEESNDGNNINNNISDDLKTDSEDEKSDDDETENSTNKDSTSNKIFPEISINKDSTSNKIVPMFQARPHVYDFHINEPIVEQMPEDANEASSMHTTRYCEQIPEDANEASSMPTTGYCETVLGFNRKGKKNMLDNLSETEITVLRGWVRKEGFRMIKFLSSSSLNMHSSIMTKMYAHMGITDDNVKMKKYSGVRYLLQRQLNSKRNYCIGIIVSQMKGMLF